MVTVRVPSSSSSASSPAATGPSSNGECAPGTSRRFTPTRAKTRPSTSSTARSPRSSATSASTWRPAPTRRFPRTSRTASSCAGTRHGCWSPWSRRAWSTSSCPATTVTTTRPSSASSSTRLPRPRKPRDRRGRRPRRGVPPRRVRWFRHRRGSGEVVDADLPLAVDKAHPGTPWRTRVDPRDHAECAVLSPHLTTDRVGEDDVAKDVDDGGVERGPGAAVDDGPAGGGRLGRLVGPLAGHRVVDIRDRRDPRELMDAASGEPLRIARSIPAFVMLSDDRPHHGGPAVAGQDPDTRVRVLADDRRLFWVEWPGLVQNLWRQREFADVVEQQADAQEGEAALDAVEARPSAVVQPAVAAEELPGEQQAESAHVDGVLVGVGVRRGKVRQRDRRAGVARHARRDLLDDLVQ